MLLPNIDEPPALTLFMKRYLLVSAWYGGLGLLATALAALITDYFFPCPVDSFSGLSLEATPMVVFMMEGALVSLPVEALRSARQRAEASALEAQSHQESLRESEELHRRVVEQAAENILLSFSRNGCLGGE